MKGMLREAAGHYLPALIPVLVHPPCCPRLHVRSCGDGGEAEGDACAEKGILRRSTKAKGAGGGQGTGGQQGQGAQSMMS